MRRRRYPSIEGIPLYTKVARIVPVWSGVVVSVPKTYEPKTLKIRSYNSFSHYITLHLFLEPTSSRIPATYAIFFCRLELQASSRNTQKPGYLATTYPPTTSSCFIGRGPPAWFASTTANESRGLPFIYQIMPYPLRRVVQWYPYLKPITFSKIRSYKSFSHCTLFVFCSRLEHVNDDKYDEYFYFATKHTIHDFLEFFCAT
jgi:hypothetical protein